MTGPSDEDLVRLVRAGDRTAFARLVKRYESRLFNYLRRMVGNSADAEDLFQDTFVKVYKNLDRFRADSPFKPWVYRIATNTARDYLRKRGRRGEVPLDAPMSDDGPSLMDRAESRDPTPEEAARSRETAARLEQAVAALPEKHRAVFLMARYDHLSYDAIAAALEIPLGTVKSRMNKAVNILMESMKAGEG